MIRAEEIANAVPRVTQAAEIVVDSGTTGAPAGPPIYQLLRVRRLGA